MRRSSRDARSTWVSRATTPALLVMPMCHANSLYFASAFAYAGRDLLRLRPQELRPRASAARRSPATRVTFTSLVPTHYIMMLGLPDAVKAALRRRQREQAADLLGAGAQGHQARDHGATSATRSSSSCTARPRRAGSRCCGRTSSSTKLGSVGRECDRLGARSGSWTTPATRSPTARSASSTRARPSASTATGRCPTRPPRRSAGPTARSATWRGATSTATTTWSTARAT